MPHNVLNTSNAAAATPSQPLQTSPHAERTEAEKLFTALSGLAQSIINARSSQTPLAG